MLIKALFTIAGMIVLHIVFKFIGFTGLLGAIFTVIAPLYFLYSYENRHKKEDTALDNAWDILDLLDISNILDFVRGRF